MPKNIGILALMEVIKWDKCVKGLGLNEGNLLFPNFLYEYEVIVSSELSYKEIPIYNLPDQVH